MLQLPQRNNNKKVLSSFEKQCLNCNNKKTGHLWWKTHLWLARSRANVFILECHYCCQFLLKYETHKCHANCWRQMWFLLATIAQFFFFCSLLWTRTDEAQTIALAITDRTSGCVASRRNGGELQRGAGQKGEWVRLKQPCFGKDAQKSWMRSPDPSSLSLTSSLSSSVSSSSDLSRLVLFISDSQSGLSLRRVLANSAPWRSTHQHMPALLWHWAGKK